MKVEELQSIFDSIEKIRNGVDEDIVKTGQGSDTSGNHYEMFLHYNDVYEELTSAMQALQRAMACRLWRKTLL